VSVRVYSGNMVGILFFGRAVKLRFKCFLVKRVVERNRRTKW
ncbi:hypothetical protein THOM_3294, partial [Trachipleistophora hominis]